MKYVVVEWSDDLHAFEAEVEKMLNDGWEFAGPLIANDVLMDYGSIRTCFYQPMIKKG